MKYRVIQDGDMYYPQHKLSWFDKWEYVGNPNSPYLKFANKYDAIDWCKERSSSSEINVVWKS